MSNDPKYLQSSSLALLLLRRFFTGVESLIARAQFSSVLEVGCGEGYATEKLRHYVPANTRYEALDLNEDHVRKARARHPDLTINVGSVYDLEYEADSFDLVVCMEVLEHLERPEAALEELCRVSRRWLLLSVPREPLWRCLNMARLKYLGELGNTPAHIQHWGSRGFREFVAQRAQPEFVRTPIPWTQVLARVESAS